ncbi:MAG TPA: tetratricopeptide repeat protein, partial [Burkholderiaceae bacterium]|nr:tetratricopeptide repeat protein [Burkholderiaceae bacterium]
RLFMQARRHALAGGDLRKAAGMLDNQALAEKQLGHYDEALRLSLESLAQQRRLGDVAGEALCLTNIAALELDRGQYEEAAVHFKAALAIADAHGLVRTRGLILANLTELSAKTHDDAAAQTYAGRALEIARSAAHRDLIAWLQLQLTGLAVRRGDLAAARSHLAAALHAATAIGRPALQLAGVACFAELLAAQGEAECARRVLAFAADQPSASPQQREELRARLAEHRQPVEPQPAWPGLQLDDLVNRLLAETDIAHAPLIALLRGT